MISQFLPEISETVDDHIFGTESDINKEAFISGFNALLCEIIKDTREFHAICALSTTFLNSYIRLNVNKSYAFKAPSPDSS